MTKMTTTNKLTTDSLGFPLTVQIEIGDFENSGTHRTYYETDSGLVGADALHRIQLQRGLEHGYLVEVVAHEVYHLFYSIRHLIAVDEETEAEVFGELVRRVYERYGEERGR